MSFGSPNPQFDIEIERAREQELEAKAEDYAQTHPDLGDPTSSPGFFRRLIGLIRRPGR